MTSDVSARVAREAQAHDESDVLTNSYRLKNWFRHIWSYPSRQRLDATLDGYLHELTNKRVLDYGCGRGVSSLRYLERGATVSGIDISRIHIEAAAKAASESGFGRERFAFQVMDAHELAFPDDTFDFVVGEGILHHLDVPRALSSVWRVLKPGGRLLLLEPLADNPLLRAFRLLTPSARTVDERPFSRKDIRSLAEDTRWQVQNAFCGLIEAPVAMATSLVIPQLPDNFFLRSADRVERWAHRKHMLDSWNQYVLFNLVKR